MRAVLIVAATGEPLAVLEVSAETWKLHRAIEIPVQLWPRSSPIEPSETPLVDRLRLEREEFVRGRARVQVIVVYGPEAAVSLLRSAYLPAEPGADLHVARQLRNSFERALSA